MSKVTNVNLPAERLVEIALERNEGILTDTGALRVTTGHYTGRSPNDKYVVRTAGVKDRIWWGNNAPMSEDAFNKLYEKVTAYLAERETFTFEGFAGADKNYTQSVRVVNEFAWQNLFVQNLFLRQADTAWSFNPDDVITILAAPGCAADPATDGTRSEAFIVLHLEKKMILIGGTHYAGEMKKSVFSAMNYFLPEQGILSMHCSANEGENGDTALFFGLSGTGKTTLSADPDRRLIGDDEHGWTSEGIFNIEGGCYAKCINLSPETEPEIWNAIQFGTVLENVDLFPGTNTANFDSEALTENTRAAYPVHAIPNSIYPGTGAHPSTIIFLTADAFGVLPPISRLTPEQAMYYFLSGYTSKLAGTERGITEPQATFSSCFGSPFLPLSPFVYANMLCKKIEEHKTRVFLINTGWQGGQYGVGKRISLRYTRKMVAAALSGELDKVDYMNHPVFQVEVPCTCPDIPAEVLQPEKNWADQEAYWQAANDLAERFQKNFANFPDVPAKIREVGPQPVILEEMVG